MSAGNETDESAAPSESAQPTPTPEPEVFNISFIGDITPDAVPYYRNSSVAYQNVVTADNLGYVFEKTIQYFEDDDFTMANFECVLSDYDVPADKNFTFRAPPSYVDILTLGSVEFVTLGNNHVEDYGEQGYADTSRSFLWKRAGLKSSHFFKKCGLMKKDWMPHLLCGYPILNLQKSIVDL